MNSKVSMLTVAASCAVMGGILLTGCSSASSSQSEPSGPEGYRGTPVTEIHLSDGTRCAVMDGSSEDVTCDWNGTKGTPNRQPEGYRGTPVTEVRLSDGTRCAVMDGKDEAIDCDWKTKPR